MGIGCESCHKCREEMNNLIFIECHNCAHRREAPGGRPQSPVLGGDICLAPQAQVGTQSQDAYFPSEPQRPRQPWDTPQPGPACTKQRTPPGCRPKSRHPAQTAFFKPKPRRGAGLPHVLPLPRLQLAKGHLKAGKCVLASNSALAQLDLHGSRWRRAAAAEAPAGSSPRAPAWVSPGPARSHHSLPARAFFFFCRNIWRMTVLPTNVHICLPTWTQMQDPPLVIWTLIFN